MNLDDSNVIEIEFKGKCLTRPLGLLQVSTNSEDDQVEGTFHKHDICRPCA